LLLLIPKRPQWTWFALCLAGFVLVFMSNYVVGPALLKDFFRVAPGLDERGTLAPGTLAFIRDVFDHVWGAGFSGRTGADELLLLASAIAIGVLSLLAILRARRSGVGDKKNAKVILYFTCVAYALAVPRMRVYSHILLLIPTLHLLRALPPRWPVPAAAAIVWALVLFPNANSLLPVRSLSHFIYEYLPLAAALGVWLGLRRILLRRPAEAHASGPASAARLQSAEEPPCVDATMAG
jgi:hypothetical protein